MSKSEFAELMREVVAAIGERPLDAALAAHLNTAVAPDGPLFGAVEAACHAAVEEGWMCKHEAGGIRYGRVLRPGEPLPGFSVDVVRMRDCVGPHHRHPQGEIDMIMPIDPGARFDGHSRGWCVYGPDSAHHPTVDGGAALVLYLLPGGEIEFTRGA